MNSILRILPHCRCQQHQHRIQLETACKHIEHEDILGDRLHKAKVAGRAYFGEAGSDVIECTGHRSEHCFEVKVLKESDQEHRYREQQHIGGQVDADTVQCASVHCLAVHGDVRHSAGMQVLADLAVHGLEHEHDTGDLHTAAGTACACADKHDQHQQGPGILGPLIEVRRSETGGRDDRRDLERRVMERLIQRREHVPHVDRDRDDRECDDAKISLQLTHLEHFAELPSQNEEVGVEVDAEHEDEHCDDTLHQSCVTAAAVVAHTEAARSGTAEGNAECVKQRHSDNDEDDDLRHSDAQVDGIQYFGSVFHARDQLADRRARALRPHEVHVVAAGHREHGKDKDDDTHAAHPVGEASPEETCVAQGFDIAQDTGSRRRKAGNRLKQSVRKVRNVLRDHQRDRAQNTDDDPAHTYDHKAFPRVIGVAAQFESGDDPSDHEIGDGQDHIDDRLFDSRESQECTGELNDDAEYFPNNGIIHNRLLSVT